MNTKELMDEVIRNIKDFSNRELDRLNAFIEVELQERWYKEYEVEDVLCDIEETENLLYEESKKFGPEIKNYENYTLPKNRAEIEGRENVITQDERHEEMLKYQEATKEFQSAKIVVDGKEIDLGDIDFGGC